MSNEKTEETHKKMMENREDTGVIPVDLPEQELATTSRQVTGPIHPAQPLPKSRYSLPKFYGPTNRSFLFYGVAALLLSIGIAGILIMLSTLLSQGVSVALPIILLAGIPVVVILFFIIWIDSWEPEPFILYAVSFVWGAGVATLLSLISTDLFGVTVAQVIRIDDKDFLQTVVAAPFMEELSKGVGLILLIVLYAKNFNGPVDGIVYGMLIGLGFAFTENVVYFGVYHDELADVFRVRAILNPFVHPLATAMMGAVMGLSMQRHSRKTLAYLLPTGLLAAFVIHALHNYSATLKMSDSTRLVFQVPIYLVAIGVILMARLSERREVMSALYEYAHAGWLTKNELLMIQTLSNRRNARLWAGENVQKSGGDPDDGIKAMTEFQSELIQLGYMRSRNLHHETVNDPESRAEEAERLDKLKQLRKVFTSRKIR